jgi:TonB-dependent starch-binding outer membrane protein SusC
MKKIYRRFSMTAALLLMLASVALAQQRQVSGTILDEAGTPMPGVNVILKGTSEGSATDSDGKFTVQVPNEQAVLVISFVGYETQEITVGAQTSLSINLAPDAETLSEIVVTGYNVQDRKEVTGAVSIVKPEQLVAVPSGNVEQQLQGRVSGVTVITNGQPGTTSVVRLRGFGSFENNEPLYVVDGVPVGSTDFLNPDDIETTTVLKDAASASIYGARASGGVIVYTTRKGSKGVGEKLKVHYNGVFGVTVPGEVDEILNPQQQADWTWVARRNTGAQLGVAPDLNHEQYGSGPNPVVPDYIMVGGQYGVVGSIDLEAQRALYNNDPDKGPLYLVMPANKAGTNWWDALTQNAILNRHTLGFSGGGDNSSFYVGLGLQDQQGIILHQRFKRYSLRINSEHNVGKRVRIGQNLQATYIQRLGLIGGNGGRGAANEESDVLFAFRMPAIIPVYDAFGGYAGTAAKGFNNPENPVASRDRGKDSGGYGFMLFGNLYGELDLIEGLTFRSSIGGAISSSYYNYYNRPSYENSENGAWVVTYGEGASSFTNWTFTNTLRYKRTFDKHDIMLMAGIEALNTGAGRNMEGSGQDPFSNDLDYITLSTVGNRVVNSNYFKGVNMYSLFGNVNYAFDGKYMASVIVRRDGASRFGEQDRYGVFPAFSAGWRISEEGFMSGASAVSDLKIRGGWGEMGNSNAVPPTNQYNLYGSSLGLAFYDIAGGNGAPAEGFYRSRLGNPAAKWETATTMNIGIDGTFFDGKWELIFDLWQKDTEDLLFQLETPAVIGPLATDPFVNIASMVNKGIDLQLINRGNITSGLKYEVNLTGSWLSNEITELAPGVEYFESGGTRIGNAIRNQVGGPMSAYFGYRVDGLFQTQAEIDAAPKQEGVTRTQDATADSPAAGVGRFRYADVNGDGAITTDDRTYLGDPIPAFTGGINIKLTRGPFELETFLYAALGFENYNFSRWFTDFYPSFTGAAYGKRVMDSWTFENGGNSTPIFENISNISTNNAHNSYYVEKGNYARLVNLQVSYNLPATMLDRIGFDKAKVYLQGTNLFTISDYSGLDPGVGGAADTTLGLDFGNPPVTRGYNIGVNLTF